MSLAYFRPQPLYHATLLVAALFAPTRPGAYACEQDKIDMVAKRLDSPNLTFGEGEITLFPLDKLRSIKVLLDGQIPPESYLELRGSDAEFIADGGVIFYDPLYGLLEITPPQLPAKNGQRKDYLLSGVMIRAPSDNIGEQESKVSSTAGIKLTLEPSPAPVRIRVAGESLLGGMPGELCDLTVAIDDPGRIGDKIHWGWQGEAYGGKVSTLREGKNYIVSMPRRDGTFLLGGAVLNRVGKQISRKVDILVIVSNAGLALAFHEPYLIGKSGEEIHTLSIDVLHPPCATNYRLDFSRSTLKSPGGGEVTPIGSGISSALGIRHLPLLVRLPRIDSTSERIYTIVADLYGEGHEAEGVLPDATSTIPVTVRSKGKRG